MGISYEDFNKLEPKEQVKVFDGLPKEEQDQIFDRWASTPEGISKRTADAMFIIEKRIRELSPLFRVLNRAKVAKYQAELVGKPVSELAAITRQKNQQFKESIKRGSL